MKKQWKERNREPLIGPPCPRCHQATEVRKHEKITAKELNRPFYYSRWYKCVNGNCRTTLIMPEAFKVFPNAAPISAASSFVPQQKFDRPTRRIVDFMKRFPSIVDAANPLPDPVQCDKYTINDPASDEIRSDPETPGNVLWG